MRALALSLFLLTALKRAYSPHQADGIGLAIFVIKETTPKMTINNYRSKFGGALLVLSLLFGIGIMSSMTAQAQNRNNGEWQRRDRNRTDNRDDRDWRRNRNRRRDNDQNRSRRDDRYDRDNRYGNNGDYNNRSQMELNQGYQAGLNTGSSDARRGQSYNPQRSHHYKDARTQQFRNGFVRGYAEGFRQYGDYNNNGDYRRGSNGGGFGSILEGILGRP